MVNVHHLVAKGLKPASHCQVITEYESTQSVVQNLMKFAPFVLPDRFDPIACVQYLTLAIDPRRSFKCMSP